MYIIESPLKSIKYCQFCTCTWDIQLWLKEPISSWHTIQESRIMLLVIFGSKFWVMVRFQKICGEFMSKSSYTVSNMKQSWKQNQAWTSLYMDGTVDLPTWGLSLDPNWFKSDLKFCQQFRPYIKKSMGPGLEWSMTWPALDPYGQKVIGRTLANIKVGYQFRCGYSCGI